MFFFKKKSKEPVPNEEKSIAFEKAFEKRLGRTPTDYILSKLDIGSDIGAIRNLFEILTAEIELRDRCKSQGFDFYYEKALSRKLLLPNTAEKAIPKVTKAFAATQLIGKERFLQQYALQLKSLSGNHDFMNFIRDLRQHLSGLELSNTPAANKQIADYFYKNDANEKFPEVRSIVETVVAYGKQASAHISIYYAMFIYE